MAYAPSDAEPEDEDLEADESEAEETDDDSDSDDTEDESAEEDDEGESGANDDMDDSIQSLSEAAKAQLLNDENFRTAAVSLKENEVTWGFGLQFALNHPAQLELNFDSLGGRYELVQPFIHQGLTATLEAITALAGEPAFQEKLAPVIRKVIISGASPAQLCQAQLTGGVLEVHVPLELGEAGPPTDDVIDALRALISPATPAQRTVTLGGSSLIFTPLPNSGAAEDIYEAARQFTIDLEAAMRKGNLWPGPKPPGAIEVIGAFGSENMSFEQWLAWIFIGRINEIVEHHDNFPSQSNVAAYAVRAFDGVPCGDIIELLANFDDRINAQGKAG